MKALCATISACKSAWKRVSAGGASARTKALVIADTASPSVSPVRSRPSAAQGSLGQSRRVRMDEITSFGAWLRRARKATDLTQAELAQRVGCAEGTIRNLEADALRPSKQLAARL